MKKMHLFFSLCFPVLLSAQKKDSSPVLNAENSFAAYSVAHGTKAAFLRYLDSNAVVFENGKAINGIQAWNKKEARPGVLNWHPVYGLMAASGDLGFTTGPWTFQPQKITDTIVARGQYATVWKKNQKGEWKALVDLGVSRLPPFDETKFQLDEMPLSFVPGTWNNLLNNEQQFMQRTGGADSAERAKWYASSVRKKNFFLNRNNRLPVSALAELGTLLSAMPQKIEYTIEGSGISVAGDVGYVYGTTMINGKTNNYLRIWQREGKEWKLALEVLEY